MVVKYAAKKEEINQWSAQALGQLDKISELTDLPPTGDVIMRMPREVNGGEEAGEEVSEVEAEVKGGRKAKAKSRVTTGEEQPCLVLGASDRLIHADTLLDAIFRAVPRLTFARNCWVFFGKPPEAMKRITPSGLELHEHGLTIAGRFWALQSVIGRTPEVQYLALAYYLDLIQRITVERTESMVRDIGELTGFYIKVDNGVEVPGSDLEYLATFYTDATRPHSLPYRVARVAGDLALIQAIKKAMGQVKTSNKITDKQEQILLQLAFLEAAPVATDVIPLIRPIAKLVGEGKWEEAKALMTFLMTYSADSFPQELIVTARIRPVSRSLNGLAVMIQAGEIDLEKHPVPGPYRTIIEAGGIKRTSRAAARVYQTLGEYGQATRVRGFREDNEEEDDLDGTTPKGMGKKGASRRETRRNIGGRKGVTFECLIN